MLLLCDRSINNCMFAAANDCERRENAIREHADMAGVDLSKPIGTCIRPDDLAATLCCLYKSMAPHSSGSKSPCGLLSLQWGFL